MLAISDKGDFKTFDITSPNYNMLNSMDARVECRVSSACLTWKMSTSEWMILVGEKNGSINIFSLNALKFTTKILNLCHKSPITALMHMDFGGK